MKKTLISDAYKCVLEDSNENPATKDNKLIAVKDPKQKIISGLEGMKPGAVLQTISKQLDTTSSKFLGTHLINIIVNAAKNGKVKFDAIKDAVKGFNDKNIEDSSKIDWEHVKLDPSGTTLKCYFDGDSKKIIDSFMKQYESEMKTLKDDIEKDNKKLHDDVKKAKVKIDDEKLEQNSLIVASTLNDEKNKGKSGKALTKEIDQKISQSKDAKELIDDANKAEKRLDSIKVEPKIANLDDNTLSKQLEQIDKEAKHADGNTSDVNSMVKSLDDKLTAKIGKDYKSSLLVGAYDRDELTKYAKKNKLAKIDLSSIKASKTIGIRIDFFGDESADVISEVVDDKAGFIVKKVDSNEKDKSIKKMFETFSRVIKDVVRDDADGKPISFLKHWHGKNEDGNFDSLYMFVGIKDAANESLSESLLVEAKEDVKLPMETVKKITDWWRDHAIETVPEAAEYQKIIELGGKSGKFSGFFDMDAAMKNGISYEQFEDAKKKLDEIKAGLKIYMGGQEFTEKVTQNGKTVLKRIVGYHGNDNFYKAIEYAKKHKEIAGDLSKISEEYLNGVDVDELEKTGDAIKSAAKIPKQAAGSAAKNIAKNADISSNQAEFVTRANRAQYPVFSYSQMNAKLNDLEDIFDDGELDSTEIKRLKSMGNTLNSYLDWVEQNKDSTDHNVQVKIAAIKRLHAKYMEILDETPVGYTTDGVGRVLDIDDIENEDNPVSASAQAKAATAAAVQGQTGEAGKAASGWKKALGLDKAFTALGVARLAAKTTGIVLNKGKALVDMAGAQAMKYKEDKDVIAEMNVLLTNGEGSTSKFEDTKFSIRFDVGDCKWHATCLDNRKMKFPEDKLLKIVFDSEVGKKFKKYCLDRWSAIFKPKDERRAIIPYIIKNAEAIGMKSGRLPKEFIKNINLMSSNFDKIESAMK